MEEKHIAVIPQIGWPEYSSPYNIITVMMQAFVRPDLRISSG